MQLELLELIFLSDKRKQLLLFLKDGPKTIDEIKEALEVTSTAILPQIKKLKEKSLVVQEDKNYNLSLIGKVLAEKMQPLVSVIDVFEDNFDYWAERDFQGIPPSFRSRLGELRKCKLIQPNLDRMFELDPEIVEDLSKSSSILECIAYFDPSLISICQELVRGEVKLSFLMSGPVFEHYSKDYLEDFRNMLAFENVKFFLYSGELKIANLTVTDRFVMISLFPKSQKHFDRESLISYEPSALKFGNELFDELLRNSTRITQTPHE
ncbi:helix-turn-helix transcriptional regulator [Methanosarcina sp. UBA5]|uniref:helix-turn-helix transcriptional regulator n=1 Tax=Methanosarcina sp. UBA5 TaxID=1915593 RepID=UPI0025D8D7CF|nr:winged helix-turn-helix domain-containing protein [Methanosarcina sp. UBA5]